MTASLRPKAMECQVQKILDTHKACLELNILFASCVFVSQFIEPRFFDEALAFCKTCYHRACFIHAPRGLQVLQSQLHTRDRPLQRNVGVQNECESHCRQFFLTKDRGLSTNHNIYDLWRG